MNSILEIKSNLIFLAILISSVNNLSSFFVIGKITASDPRIHDNLSLIQ